MLLTRIFIHSSNVVKSSQRHMLRVKSPFLFTNCGQGQLMNGDGSINNRSNLVYRIDTELYVYPQVGNGARELR